MEFMVVREDLNPQHGIFSPLLYQLSYLTGWASLRMRRGCILPDGPYAVKR